jgi:hypothetical protein
MTTILIEDQETKQPIPFEVKDKHHLSQQEVDIICEKTNWKALFIEGKYYEKTKSHAQKS